MPSLPQLLAAAGSEPVVRLTTQARIVAAILAIAFMLMILELIRRHKLQERYSVIWFVAGIAMLVGAAFPDLLRLLAEVLGVRDVTIALFSLLFVLLLGLALSFSVIVSRQAEQITRLAQERALAEARAQEVEGKVGDVPVVRRPYGDISPGTSESGEADG